MKTLVYGYGIPFNDIAIHEQFDSIWGMHEIMYRTFVEKVGFVGGLILHWLSNVGRVG